MKKSQLSRIAKSSIVLCALLLATGSTRIYADAPGAHPAYLHAIDYLRQARDLLNIPFSQPAYAKTAAEAKPKIEAAINELKEAARIDEKNLKELPPPDNSLKENARFHKVAELLQMAHHDSSGPEADPNAKPFRDKAWKDMDEANAVVQKVL
jgi:hypothetical protein